MIFPLIYNDTLLAELELPEASRVLSCGDFLIEKDYAFIAIEYDDEEWVSFYKERNFEILNRIGPYFWMGAYKKKVRLSLRDSIALEITFQKHFLKNDHLWIFGSRADLSRRGGDIDLYIETNAQDERVAMRMKTEFLGELEDKIGEQKIDCVLNMLNFPYSLPIHKIAKQEGVLLV